MADTKAMLRGLYAGITSDADIGALVDEHVTHDFIEHEEMPGTVAASGRDQAVQSLSAMQGAFSDLRFNVEDIIAEGDKVVARLTITGTHTGEFMDIPASGNKIDVKVIDIFQLRDDRISAHWGVTDSAAMMMQIGALEPPG